MIAHGYEDRRLRMLAERAVGPRVLDLGYANLPNKYLLERTGLRVTGLDAQEPPPGCGYHEVLRGDVTRLPEALGERRFDSILAGELIEHLESPYDFLRGLKGALEPRGVVVLSTPNPLGLPMVLCELLDDKRRFYSREHTYSFTPRWMKRMIDLAGFELLRVEPVGVWCPGVVIPWAPVTLSYQVVYVATPRA